MTDLEEDLTVREPSEAIKVSCHFMMMMNGGGSTTPVIEIDAQGLLGMGVLGAFVLGLPELH